MAHPINDAINRMEKKKAIPCDDKCIYWKFPHLESIPTNPWKPKKESEVK